MQCKFDPIFFLKWDIFFLYKASVPLESFPLVSGDGFSIGMMGTRAFSIGLRTIWEPHEASAKLIAIHRWEREL